MGILYLYLKYLHDH
jgi:hypothetical protein